MTDDSTARPRSLTRRLAAAAATADRLPTAPRALFGYYADTGEFAVGSLELRRYVDRFLNRVVRDAFDPVERAIADAFDVPRERVEFEYDTKLTLPAELTLSHLFGRIRREATPRLNPLTGALDDGPLGPLGRLRGPTPTRSTLADARDRLTTVREVTRLVIVALIDGDVRDAINDDEYEDFVVGFPVDDGDRARIAELTQSVLAEQVAALFEGFSDAVRDHYRAAVDYSEAHQDRDPYFRELMADAQAGDANALAAVESEYKFADFDDPPELFSADERELPYLRSQYGRVGVIYHGMVEMYRAAGAEIEPAFERSIVLSIIGAQIWLDDVDDYAADAADGQLTPVTAEYLLADDDETAVRRVVDVTERYLGAAKAYAATTDSGLAGIGADYIRRSGSVAALPGSDTATE